MEKIWDSKEKALEQSHSWTKQELSQTLNTIDLNWIDTLFINLPHATSTTVMVMVKAWSLYETKENNWIGHITEHMVFKWWEKYKTAKDVTMSIEEFWWEINAWTLKDYAEYYVKSAPEHVELSIDVLSDILVYPRFNSRELWIEKWAIIWELKMYKDDPQEEITDKFDRFFYWDTQQWRTIIWTIKSIKKCTSTDLHQHHKGLYTKDNIIIVVAWKILDIDKIKQQISDKFSWLPNVATIQKPTIIHTLPKKRTRSFNKWTEQTHVLIWAKWFSRFEDYQKALAARILTTLLWWNSSSRLYLEFREKHWLWYYIYAWHQPWDIWWKFIIWAWIEKEKVSFWLDVIDKEIDKIARWEFTEKEFQRALWYSIWELQLNLEKTDSIAEFFWRHYLLNKRAIRLDEHIQAYKRVKFEDLLEIAHMLSQENLYMCSID